MTLEKISGLKILEAFSLEVMRECMVGPEIFPRVNFKYIKIDLLCLEY